MAHNNNTNYRRNLASQHPNPPSSMDPTEKQKYPIIYHPSSSHPQPPTPSDTSIHSISNNFSKLYTNHKILSSLKPTDKLIHQHPHPHPEPSIHTSFRPKHVPISSNLDSSCTTLTKSKSQHGGRFNVGFIVPNKQGTKTKVVKERALVKAPEIQETTQKEWKTKELIEEKVKKLDVKKAQSFMSRSYSEGFNGVKIPSFSLGSGGRRKSFCSSQIELADFLLSSGVKLVAVDMPPYMQIHAVDCARKAHDSLEKFTARSLACTLKREFDGVYGPAWHCIVGTSFGSFVTHSVGGFMYFSMDQKLYILLFKTTVQKAE